MHCWTLLKEVLRWWESPLEVQKRTHGGEGSPGGSAMAARISVVHVPPGVAIDVQEHDGAIAEGEGLGSVESAARELVRPRGQKVAKQDLLEARRRESILKSQARATEQMVAANMRKAEAMQDHSTMTLFKMNLEDLDEGAREYFQPRRQEELERIKRRIDAEKRVAEREIAEHEKLLQEQQEREADVQRQNRPRTAPRGTPPAPPTTTPLPTPPTATPPSTRDDSALPGTSQMLHILLAS